MNIVNNGSNNITLNISELKREFESIAPKQVISGIWEGSSLWMSAEMLGYRVKMDRPVHAEAADFTGTGVAAERGALEVESVLTMKPNWAENWVGPASRRRDNIGAPAL